MSLNGILNTATSGMQAAQMQLRVVSDNITNVNTPGYVRKVGEQVSLSTQGAGAGVEVARVRLMTDRFLQSAAFNSGSEAARQGARADLYDRIQGLFGDPGGDNGVFSQIEGVFAAFTALTETATSSPLRQDVLFKTQATFDEARRIAQNIQSVREDADGRIQSAVEKANTLLQQIEGLNLEIARATATSSDASGAETAQAALVGQLADIMDIRVAGRAVGGVSIRTNGGVLLAGQGAATLEYRRAGTVNSETGFNDIWVTEPGGVKRALLDSITSGEIKGLVELRDVDAPQAAERLAELVTHFADELNRAHNANAAVPPPNRLSGRNVGMDLATAVTGFSGRTTVAVTDAAGMIQARAEIVFSGGTMTVNGAAATPATFLSVLNSQLGGAATASFADGALSIQAANTAHGVAVADDATTPSDKAGRGFSHYFGLNDLVSSERPALYDTGLTAASAHGFTAGETLTFRFTGASGARERDVQVAVPAGGTVGDVISALNDPVTGAGRYGSFALGTDGTLTFTATGSPPPTLSVIEDRTTQVPSGISMSEMFGFGGTRASRADGFSVRADIRQAPTRLALAKLNLAAAAGTSALSAGDGRGAALLSDAGQRATAFQAAGGSAAGSQTVSRYAAELAGDIGGRAAATQNAADTARALNEEAEARQSAHEGVNLDEELVLMTTYQQAFNASARLIQSAREMYDTLLGMI